MDGICTVVIVFIVCYVGIHIIGSVNDKNMEHIRKVEAAKKDFNAVKEEFDDTLSHSFKCDYKYRRNDTYSKIYCYKLKQLIPEMERENRCLVRLSKNDDYSEIISSCSELAEEFNAFGERANQIPSTCMMDPVNYGRIQTAYMDSVRSMSKSSADVIIESCERNITSCNYSQVFEIDIEAVLRCIWFYATDKPYSAESFEKAKKIFCSLVDNPRIDVTIAELYAMKQIGGENVLEDVLRNRIRNNRESIYTDKENAAENLTLLASALMWMNADQAENMVLQHMLSNGIQMTAKAQERLSYFTNSGR